jgi:hypothetical protein
MEISWLSDESECGRLRYSSGGRWGSLDGYLFNVTVGRLWISSLGK